MSYTNIILQNEFPFEYSIYEMNTPAVVEYSKIFEHLDLSHIQRYSYGVGQYDNHSMIKAFMVYALEGYRSIPQLIRELKCKPYLGEASQYSPTFKKLYPKRQAVERVNAFIQNLGWENPKCYSKKEIENIIGFALLGKTLKTFL